MIAIWTREVNNILSCTTYPGAPSYGGVRTWVEGPERMGTVHWLTQAVLNHYTDYIHIKTKRLPTNNAQYIRFTNTQANGG